MTVFLEGLKGGVILFVVILLIAMCFRLVSMLLGLCLQMLQFLFHTLKKKFKICSL